MIIFDLDGTLADCEHRRHFVDPKKNTDVTWWIPDYGDPDHKGNYIKNGLPWKPDYQSFYEACDQDVPIESVISIWNNEISLGGMGSNMIWSGRCESVREKTEKWLDQHLLCFEPKQLKMRPIGNYDPDDQLKEMWLNDAKILEGKTIDFVFDDRPKVIRMWRRYGIFVFNCCQHSEEF